MNVTRYVSLPFLFYNSLFWLLILFINFSAVFSDSLRSDSDFNALRSLAILCLAWAPWLCFTPLMYAVIHWAVSHYRKNRMAKMYTLMFIVWVPFYIVYDSRVMLWNLGLGGKTILEGLVLYPKFYWFFDAVIFSAMFGGYLALLYYRDVEKKRLETLTLNHQNTQLELKLSELKMQALQAQLEPHFLFNALNSISSLVRIADKKQAITAIRKLSDLLRFAIDASRAKQVAMVDEWQFTRDYVDLQQLRFGERLKVAYGEMAGIDGAACPPYILQTLVENAIVHNLENSSEPVRIDISIHCDGKTVSIVVCNSLAAGEDHHAGLGVGLTNLTERLNTLFPGHFSFDTRKDHDSYRVILSFPWKTIGDSPASAVHRADPGVEPDRVGAA